MIWTTRLISLLALAASVTLSEANDGDVWAPPIIYPNSATRWYVGSRHHVLWDTNNPPRHITQPRGQIILVQKGDLLFDHVLAENFNITEGSVAINVPDVKPGKYQLDLFGDSGDRSELFEILSR